MLFSLVEANAPFFAASSKYQTRLSHDNFRQCLPNPFHALLVPATDHPSVLIDLRQPSDAEDFSFRNDIADAMKTRFPIEATLRVTGFDGLQDSGRFAISNPTLDGSEPDIVYQTVYQTVFFMGNFPGGGGLIQPVRSQPVNPMCDGVFGPVVLVYSTFDHHDNEVFINAPQLSADEVRHTLLLNRPAMISMMTNE